MKSEGLLNRNRLIAIVDTYFGIFLFHEVTMLMDAVFTKWPKNSESP